MCLPFSSPASIEYWDFLETKDDIQMDLLVPKKVITILAYLLLSLVRFSTILGTLLPPLTRTYYMDGLVPRMLLLTILL